MRPGGDKERAELVGGPDLDGFADDASWPLRSGGRVRGEQLLDINGISECLAQCAMDVRDCGR